MLHLSAKWAEVLARQPETGMGYQVATVRLHDGRAFVGAVIVGGIVTSVRGHREIPFAEADIAEIIVNSRSSG